MYDVQGTSTVSYSSPLPRSDLSQSLKVRVFLEQDDEGWLIASTPDVQGAHSQGKTREEAVRNFLESLTLVLEETTGQADLQFLLILQQ